MTKLLRNSDFLCVSSEKLFIFSLKNDKETPRVIKFQSHLREKVSKEDKICPDCCELSPCGQYLILCVQKELLFYGIKTAELLDQVNIEKTASCVRFFNKSQRFLVADRSGCVWFFTFTDHTLVKESTHLGHNSILTDALVSENDDYVITCDRDEKIRVSHYPNVHNIQSFCLGHEEFVSSLSLLPSDSSVLVSTSGDGTLRLWDFVNGKELLSFKENESVPFVKAVCCLDSSVNLVAVEKYDSKDFLILSIAGSKCDGFHVEKQRMEHLPGLVIDMAVEKSSIVLLQMTEDKPCLVQLPKSSGKLDCLGKIEEGLADMRLVANDSIQLLFKKRVDNVEGYQARKRARLEDKNKK